MNHRRISLLSLLSGVLLAGASAQEPSSVTPLTADEIVRKANEASYYAGKDGRADVTMTITDKSGGTRERQFRILRINGEGGNQKFYVYFKEPADVRKMAYLVWKNVGPGQEDDRWLWMPALNLVRRVAPGDKRTSFVGSDFLYEDVSGRNLDADVHELEPEENNQYVIKNTPKNPGEVEFAWYRVWIDKTTFLPTKAAYYDKADVLYREVEAEKVEVIGGHPTVVVSVARDLKSGTSTRNAFSDVRYDLGFDDGLFTERFLRRPPREVTAQ